MDQLHPGLFEVDHLAGRGGGAGRRRLRPRRPPLRWPRAWPWSRACHVSDERRRIAGLRRAGGEQPPGAAARQRLAASRHRHQALLSAAVAYRDPLQQAGTQRLE